QEKESLMKRLRVAAVISWLWLVVVATAQGLPPVTSEDEAWGPQDPTRSAQEVIIDVGGPGDPGPWMPPSQRAARTRRTAPTWVTYSFFFSRLDSLDRAGDAEAARGNPTAAAGWRNHEQLAAGLDERQGAALKQVAADCLKAVAAKDAEIQKAVAAFRGQHPDGAYRTAPLTPELLALWQQRIEIFDQQIGRLQSLLGADGFHKLDSYVRANFVPAVVQPDAAKGGAQ